MLYHSNSIGPDPKVFKIAFLKSLGLALASNKEMKICVHTKNQLKASIIVDALGDKFVKNLLKGDILVQGVTIKLETEKIIIGSQMVILAPHINPKYLEKLIDKNGNADVVYIPWTQNELDEYLKKYPNSIAI